MRPHARLSANGYPTTMVSDAVSSFAPDLHAATLKNLASSTLCCTWALKPPTKAKCLNTICLADVARNWRGCWETEVIGSFPLGPFAATRLHRHRRGEWRGVPWRSRTRNWSARSRPGDARGRSLRLWKEIGFTEKLELLNSKHFGTVELDHRRGRIEALDRLSDSNAQ